MPGGDGTGPFGMGPRMGRKMGWCKGYLYPEGHFSSRRMGIIGALIPIAGALIRDVFNPHGLLRSFGNKLLTGKTIDKNKAIDADYSVITENKSDKNKTLRISNKK
ncbi:MAG: DUF5320 domain-containing protein [Chitinispirillia bacterium]|jgi:hypothetical protein